MYQDAYTIWKNELHKKLADKIRGHIDIYYESEGMVIEIQPYECDFKFVKIYANMPSRIVNGATTKDYSNEIIQKYKYFLNKKFFRWIKDNTFCI